MSNDDVKNHSTADKTKKTRMKQTEIGLMPEDWEVVLLNNLADFDGGFAFKSSTFIDDGEFQVIKMANLYNGKLDLNRNVSCVNSLNSAEEKAIIKKNDILITLTGTTGYNTPRN